MSVRIRNCIFCLIAALCACLCSGCAPSAAPKTMRCTVLIETGKDYYVRDNIRSIPRGSDTTFSITLHNGCRIESTDYPDYTLSHSDTEATLTLHNVRYPTVVRLRTTYEMISYYANGGKRYDNGDAADPVRIPASTGHIRYNTTFGTDLFYRNGYVAIGWNTRSDGSGTHIGFGSRADRETQTELYTEWRKANNESDFLYEIRSGTAVITDYTGDNGDVVIPTSLGGNTVVRIAADAFRRRTIGTLVLPESLRVIEPNAFSDSTIREIYLFDSLTDIADACFARCSGWRTLHVNAAVLPVYSGTYFDTFSDKVDWLQSIASQRKIVLFSGSSARFGYDSPAIMTAFPDYQVANMGVYAYSPAKPQLHIIRASMPAGDIVLGAPEFDAIDTQFCTSDAFDRNTFSLTESDYDNLALLDLREFTAVFDSLGEFLDEKHSMQGKSYSVSPKNYDEDENPVPFETYNIYGDFIFPRPNAAEDKMHRFVRVRYTPELLPLETIERLNTVYRSFTRRDITVLFTYAPRNRSSLTDDSTPETWAQLDERIRSHLCVPVISDIKDSLLSGIYFYQIDNHLSDEGVRIRTANVIEDLRCYFASLS